MKLFMKIILTFIFLSLSSCGGLWGKKDKDKEEVSNKPKKERKTFNVRDRVMSEDTGGIVFGGKKEDPLGGQNVMWVATLNVLDFIPILSASYDGGLIVTDWYYVGNSDESLKINISFTSNKVALNSVQVKSYKKLCKNGLNCKTVKADESFNKKIKDQIFAEVRKINTGSK